MYVKINNIIYIMSLSFNFLLTYPISMMKNLLKTLNQYIFLS
jgi:hypothetical protein